MVSQNKIAELFFKSLFLIFLGLLDWMLFFGGSRAVIIILSSAVLITLVFGNFWCGFFCPLVIVQMLFSAIRSKLHIPALRVSAKTRALLRPLRWVVFICFLASLVLYFLRLDLFVQIRSFSGMNIIGIVVIVVLAGICFMTERALCRYCPILTVMGMVNKISFGRIRKKVTKCTHCRVCLKDCPMDIQSVYRERIKSDVTNFNCVYCLHCIKSCPERGVLSFTLFGKTVMASGRNKTHQDQKNEKNL